MLCNLFYWSSRGECVIPDVGMQCVTGVQKCALPISPYPRMDCYGRKPRGRRHTGNPRSSEHAGKGREKGRGKQEEKGGWAARKEKKTKKERQEEEKEKVGEETRGGEWG